MKKQLLVSIALALGLQCLAYTNGASAEEAAATRAQPVDETWGIGLRIAQTETPPAAVDADVSAMTVADLEAAFWMCDYLATTRGVDATPIAICSAVYDELKATKFAGDFNELLAWWKENKPAEHERIAVEQSEGAVERVDTRF